MRTYDLARALMVKLTAVLGRFKRLNPRYKARCPARLQWVMDSLTPDGKSEPPKGYCTLVKGLMRDESVMAKYATGAALDYCTEPEDMLARTYCALEDFDDWLTRVEDGVARHEEELKRQCASKMVRLQTYAVSIAGKEGA